MGEHRQRITPTDNELATLRERLAAVPPLSHDWTSDAGQRFLYAVHTANQAGVPVAWLAEHLDLKPDRLHAALARYRSRRPSRKRTSA